MAVVKQPVQDGGCHDLVAQHHAPVARGAVRRDQDAAPLVAAADELEQQMGRRGLKREVAELVHNQQFCLANWAIGPVAAPAFLPHVL